MVKNIYMQQLVMVYVQYLNGKYLEMVIFCHLKFYLHRKIVSGFLSHYVNSVSRSTSTYIFCHMTYLNHLMVFFYACKYFTSINHALSNRISKDNHISCWSSIYWILMYKERVKVMYPKYSKHWPYTVADTIACVCRKMLHHGLNHGLFLSLFKLIPCHIHWIVYVLAYLKFIFEF